MVFPARIADQTCESGENRFRKSAPIFSAPVPPTNCTVAARFSFSTILSSPKTSFCTAFVIKRQTVDRQVGMRTTLCGDPFFGFLNAFQQGNLAIVVIVDTDAQIDFVRVGVRIGKTSVIPRIGSRGAIGMAVKRVSGIDSFIVLTFNIYCDMQSAPARCLTATGAERKNKIFCFFY